MTKRTPEQEIQSGKAAMEAELAAVVQKLADVRAQEAALLTEQEEIVARAVPILGGNEVMRIAGFKSRSSLYKSAKRPPKTQETP